MNYKVGIIGYGFVGKAVYASYHNGLNITMSDVIDPLVPEATGSYETLNNKDAVYVCVPSPQSADGSCDVSILLDVMSKLKQINFGGVIISKVTAPPSVYTKLSEEFGNLVYVPEFLTAVNAVNDYLNTKNHIIGGKTRAYVSFAEQILRDVFPWASFRNCSIEEASTIKYAVNCFLSTKVMFFNELKELCDMNGSNFDLVTGMMKLDERIGRSHMQVPGPDGSLGFGGACFPKDTSALLTYAKENNIILSVLQAAVDKNNTLR
jgi:UDPglucose 6-dehydrogenase